MFIGDKDTSTEKKYGMIQSLKSISRDAAVSKNLAKFFTHYLNQIIEDNYKDQISVVYSGGDDLFLIGAWDRVIDCAFEINKKFKKYTLGALSLSAGISIHGPKFPLYRMAKDSGLAEKVAKKQPGKSSLCIYLDNGIFRDDNPSHVFSWDEWENEIIPLHNKLISFNLPTGYLHNLLVFFKDLLERKTSYFYKILYDTVRMEEANNELKESNKWKEFKQKFFQDLENKNNPKYYETALNWVLLLAREVEKEEGKYEHISANKT